MSNPSSTSSSDSPKSVLGAPHFVFFQTLTALARFIVVTYLNALNSRVSGPDCFKYTCKLVNCMYSLIRVELTLRLTPARITPAQLQRLARAAAAIQHLAAQPIDFSPWLPADSNPDSIHHSSFSIHHSDSPSPSPSPSPSDSETPHTTAIPDPQSSTPQSKIQSLQSNARFDIIKIYETYNNSPQLPDLNSLPATEKALNPVPSSPNPPDFRWRNPSLCIPPIRHPWPERLFIAKRNSSSRRAPSMGFVSESLSNSELFGLKPQRFCSRSATPGATLARIFKTLNDLAKFLGPTPPVPLLFSESPSPSPSPSDDPIHHSSCITHHSDSVSTSPSPSNSREKSPNPAL